MNFSISYLQFNVLDIVLAVILLIAFIRGVWTGFSRALASLLGMVVGFAVAARYYQVVALKLVPWLENEAARSLTAFFIIFLIVYLAFVIAGILVRGVLAAAKLSWMDRFMGGIMGIAKGIVACALVIFLLTLTMPPDSSLLKQSVLAPRVSEITRIMISFVPPDIKAKFMYKWRRLFPATPPGKVDKVDKARKEV